MSTSSISDFIQMQKYFIFIIQANCCHKFIGYRYCIDGGRFGLCLYSDGVMPVSRLKNFVSDDGQGKFSLSAICAVVSSLYASHTFISLMAALLIHCIGVEPLVCFIRVLR